MLLPELNLPVGFAGKDGFYWWFGQVESEADPKNSNRHKVRIVGHHVMSCDAVSVDDLPWAVCMFPVTHPAAEGNSTYTPSGLQKGAWVIGFFMDGARGQQPVIMIMGTLGKVTNSSKDTSLSNKFGNDECLAFKRYVPDTNPIITQSAGSKKDATARPGGNNPVGSASVASASSGAEGPPGAKPYARFGCIERADAKCDDPNQSKSRFEQILTELFGAVSQNGGQIGTQLLSEASGKLFDYASAANGYVTRVFGVAKAYLRAGKFKLYALLKEGVKAIIKFVMAIPKPDVNPKTGEAIKTKKTGALGKLTEWLNEQLGKINCQIADLEDKVFNFLSDLLFGLLSDVVSGALCVIEATVSKILSELESFLTSTISAILGPLQSILGIIASPLNIIGAALNYIFTLFGITCSGAGNKCADAENLKLCTGSANKKKPGEDDFKALDDLIANIEKDGVTELQTSCEQSQSLPCPEPTAANVAGGTPNPDEFTGPPVFAPTDPPDEDFDDYFNDIPNDIDQVQDTPIPPTPVAVNETVASEVTALVAGSTVLVATVNGIDTYVYPSSGEVQIESASTIQFSPTFSIIETTNYTLTANKTQVSQGETITFTLTCTNGNVSDGTVFNYIMFGLIQASDFSDGTTSGSMIMNGNVAIKNITISNNISIATSETVLFSVAQSGLAVNFDIINSNYDPTDPFDQPKQLPIPNTFTPPVLGEPEVDNNGNIIFIPILNPGDPYSFPPFVNITGEGFGAAATAELDTEGKLSKIIIKRPGVNYLPNKKQDTNCVLDSFVIIRPGSGYTSDTVILLDGEPNLAKPVVNDAGNIISVDIINKVKTYEKLPKVEIIGGGAGAKMIPSLSCLATQQYNQYVTDFAPSGTDSVIDCP